MADPTTSPEDHSKHSDVAFGDSVFDPGLFADATRTGNVVSRANSISSTSASSVPNTDDEDSDCRHETSYKNSYKDRRRQAHTRAEQKRRDAIKKGYNDLQSVVPTCLQSEFAVGAQKISKATILQKTIEYIKFLHKEKKKQDEDVSRLRKEVTALKIMKTLSTVISGLQAATFFTRSLWGDAADLCIFFSNGRKGALEGKRNYEQILKTYQTHPQQGEDQVSDQVKFNIFQSIMDSLFYSFSSSVSVNSFQELSASVINWIEEHCKPLMLKEFVVGVLQQINGQLY
ncbi:max-like protein X isoform X1 [Syngnathoides biaculeatus]|uniref:max-like protein X isoform X1 n=1 Tax=Syngnathoides biaculeatus TaxID=300417 RepID=UPI002ADDE1F5|nr:max-like protein X isoform X1 [Syngnathoides biaculeatus]